MNRNGRAWNDVGRPEAPPAGGRIVYRPADLVGWISGKTVAVIGDGESKRKYIFAPEEVMTIAINKAGLWYPADMVAVVENHFDEIMIQLKPWIPILYFGTIDIRRNNIGPSLWTTVVLLSFLRKHAGRILIQGFDLSKSKYRNQLPLLSALEQTDGAKIINVGGGSVLPFKSEDPENKEIC